MVVLKNDFTKILVKRIKKLDKYKLYCKGSVNSLIITKVETKVLRFEPYSEYTEFDVVVDNRLSLTMKIYTNGDFELY